ncbi:MAG: ribosome maturation factor RimM [Acidimicrobiales bacterium]
MALLEVGRVVKPHGLAGEVVVRFVSNRPERLRPGSRLVVGPAAAGPDLPAELTVATVRPHLGCHLVRFEGVVDRAAAEQLRGAILLAEPLTDAGALFVHELIGAEVVDVDGVTRGRVTALEANPASDLLVVDGRHLVPVRFVVESSPGRIVVEVPAGIFE